MRPIATLWLGLCALTAATAAPEAVWQSDGRLSLSVRGEPFLSTEPGLFEPGWRFHAGVQDRAAEVAAPSRAFKVDTASGVVSGRATASRADDGVKLVYRLTPPRPMPVNTVFVALNLAADRWRGGSFELDGERHELPVEFGGVVQASKPGTTLKLTPPDGPTVTIKCDAEQTILVQDNRQWGATFGIRIGPGGDPLQWSEPLELALTISLEGGMEFTVDQPVTLQADDNWLPLPAPLDIQPGSALDFGPLGLVDAPAGKHGWVEANQQGQLVFPDQPNQPVKLYGVNFCFSALYPDHELADRVADRLVALGYNTVRIHHYERDLVDSKAPDSLTFKPDALDRFDYFCAALTKRGIYLTTDLYVSRPIKWAEVYADGTDPGNYKLQVLLNPRARENLKEWTRRLFGHVNPYTGKAWANDPSMAFISLVNEGVLLNYLGGLSGRQLQDLQGNWNQWLAQRYGTRDKLATAWGDELKAGEDPTRGTVVLRRNKDGKSGRDLTIWAGELHASFYRDLKSFLRDEVGTKALLCDLNAWNDVWPVQAVRTQMDYVDNHSYWDHPHFLEQQWRLPSRGWSNGESATVKADPLSRSKAVTQLLDRAFGFSEYNYAAPNAHRAEGGPLTGAYAALQGWDAIWRFAYSHSVADLGEEKPSSYFNLASDPAMQASDRFAVLLFRRDAAQAKNTVAITATMAQAEQAERVSLNSKLDALSLITRVGTRIDFPLTPMDEVQVPVDGPLDLDGKDAAEQVLAKLKASSMALEDNPSDLAAGLFVSDNGQLRLDSPAGLFTYDTPGSVGVFSARGEAGQAGLLSIAPDRGPLAVYLASVTDEPIASSRRLLLAYLPELQGIDRKFGESARQTLLAWGKLPHLARLVTTKLTLQVDQPGALQVYALGTDGARLGQVPATVADGKLSLDLSTKFGDRAVIYYELVRE